MPYMKSSDHSAAASTLDTPSVPPWKYEFASLIRHCGIPLSCLAFCIAANWPGSLPPGWVEASRPEIDALVLSPTYVCIERITRWLFFSCEANGDIQSVCPYVPGPSNTAVGTLARIALTYELYDDSYVLSVLYPLG